MSRISTTVPLLPGGYGRSSYFLGGAPPTVVRGDGYRVWDEEGAVKIDLNGNYSVLVHGHGHPAIRAEIEAAAREGLCFGAPNQHELAHARLLVDRIPWAEQVRYTNSGTEAVMTAIRMARASTGRDLIVMQSPDYHGTADTALPAIGGPAHRGVPDGISGDIITIAVGDADALRRAVDAAGDRLAAVLVDLMPTSGGCRPLPAEYVHAARELTSAAGAYLVVDEVISFRGGMGGLGESLYGLQPELVALGKLIGGGLPVGAVVGTRETMAVLDPYNPDAIPHGGTFAANAATMRAGSAALQHLNEEALARIDALGARLRGALREVLAPIGWHASGHGSVARIAPIENDSVARRQEFWRRAYDQGVLVSVSGMVCASTVMTESVIDEAVTRLGVAVRDGEDL